MLKMKMLNWMARLGLIAVLASCGGGGGDAGTSAFGGGGGTTVGTGAGTGTGTGGAAAVVLFSTAPSSLIVPVGGVSQNYTISGGKPNYSVTSSNPAVAAATVTTAGFIVNGVGGGTAVLTIKDAVGAAVNVAVTVGSGTALFSTAPANVAVAIGANQTYMLGGGAAPFIASSANGAVATAIVSGTSLTITGVSLGSTTVNVRDSLGTALSLDVSSSPAVPLFTSAPNDVSIATGVSATYRIGGGIAGYTATSTDARVATVSVTGTTVTIVGAASGTAKVVVRDSVGSNITVNLTIGSPIALFSSAPAAISSLPGATQTYTIGGGEGPYVVGTSDSAAATAAVNGSTLSISGVATGTAQVVIKDALGAAVSVGVTVTPAASIPLAVTPLAVTASVGDRLRFTITGGDGPYRVTVNNANIASVSPLTVDAIAATFEATLLNAGATTIAIIDNKGQTRTVSLTVNQLQPLLRLSPSVVAISELSNADVVLGIYGGAPTYTAFSSDLSLATAIVGVNAAGLNIVTVQPGTAGNRCISPATLGYVTTTNTVEPFGVSTGTVRVVITVVDGTGRSTTSDLFLVDSAGACP